MRATLHFKKSTYLSDQLQFISCAAQTLAYFKVAHKRFIDQIALIIDGLFLRDGVEAVRKELIDRLNIMNAKPVRA